MKRRLNLGCGMDYQADAVNVDFNGDLGRIDVLANFDEGLPFKDNYFEDVYLDNTLEHITREHYFAFLDEVHRVCKAGATVRIYVPHFTGIFALPHPTHFNYFGVGSLSMFGPQPIFTGERYGDSRFHIRRERLMFFHHKLVHTPFLSALPINWMFNFGRLWQKLMERFQFFGFDEIYYELEVIKES